MNFPWEVVFLSLFYLALFVVACSVLTSSIKQVIHEWYACKYAAQMAKHEHEHGTLDAVIERMQKNV